MTSQIKRICYLGIVCAASTAYAQAPSTSELFERVNSSVCTIASIDQYGNLLRRGSGFILQDGRLVTNAHVLAGYRQAEVKCNGQVTEVTRITNFDGEVDLVLAETGKLDIKGLELSSVPAVSPGTQVYAFGSPYGLEGTITPGLTSAYREIEGRTYIQISTPISPGSSGGPITDSNGIVIGVTVAALEVAQNINFAVPVSAIAELPEVDMQLSDISWGGEMPSLEPFQSATRPSPAFASERSSFRGHAFGTQCGEVATSEYEDRLLPGNRKGLTEFRKSWGGQLKFDVEVLGARAIAAFSCSERYGLFAGHYEIDGHSGMAADFENEISREYGTGVPNPIADAEARQLGCRFSSSLNGSRFYRPSQRTTWNVDDRMRVDMLVCGGQSTRMFIFFGDPMLADTINRSAGGP